MIVSTETAGLGNRIKSWVSAMRLDPDVRVHWQMNENMPAPFSQLFTNNCNLDSIPKYANTHKSWRFLVLPEDESHLPRGFSTVGSATHPIIRGTAKAWWSLMGKPSDRYRYMIFPKTHSKRSTRPDARHIDLEYERIPKYFRDIYVPLFKKIKVQPNIMERVNDWSHKNLDENVIGVQVRTWRDDLRRHKKYYKPAVKRLSHLMENTQNKDRFLIVSDSDDVILSLTYRYGNKRILHFPRSTPRFESYQSYDGTAEDLIDMLILSKTHRLFSSYLSTFSEAAWWFGGAQARVWVF